MKLAIIRFNKFSFPAGNDENPIHIQLVIKQVNCCSSIATLNFLTCQRMLIPIKTNVFLREAVTLPDRVYENVENWDYFLPDL